MKRRTISLILAAVMILAAGPAQALAATVDYNASSSSNATVTVEDDSGNPVTGATVTVTRDSNSYEVAELGAGKYAFTKDSSSFFASYSISVSAAGYETGSTSMWALLSSATVTLTAVEETTPVVPEETTTEMPEETTTEPEATRPDEPSEPETDTSNIEVKIVSFMRGEQTDLRSSELLLAQVEGYAGNALALTYKWTNDLGTTVRKTNYATYLYVYDSHNMYVVRNTDHEQEIHNTDRGLDAMSAMESAGRSHDQTYSGVGFAYAAVYGANIDDSRQYTEGSITVEVYEGNTLLGTATYSGFGDPSLQTDLDQAVFGVFEGETIGVKDLLGESAIVHVNCTACEVTSASIVSGDEYIVLEDKTESTSVTPDYYVTGVAKGVASIKIYLSKGNCKFHQYTEGTAGPLVHVFKKPVVTPGVTTLSLTNLDPDCTYYIGGAEGTLHADGSYTFDGLQPSTEYEIEVHGNYTDNGEAKVVYTFVYGTTLELNTGSVVIRLDNVLVEGESVAVSGVTLKPADGTDKTYELNFNSDSMSYIGSAPDGVYEIYDSQGNRLGGDLQLEISADNTTAVIDFYTVTYALNGGIWASTETVTTYSAGTQIYAAEEVPVKKGYRFAGWSSGSGVYAANEQITDGISAPVVLTASWTAVQLVFHSNNDYAAENGDDSFRTYYIAGAELPEGEYYNLNEDGTVPVFYDIPVFDYQTHNNYIFRGWYTQPDDSGTAVDWAQVYDMTQDVHIYAHWIETGSLVQENDNKQGIQDGTYKGYDLIGVQLRRAEKDDGEYYGNVASGLRFLTVLSEDVWTQLLDTHSSNATDAEYGILLCKDATAANYLTADDEMKYRGANVNGENTQDSSAYLKNVKCSGISDHFNGVGYRIYTAVVTFGNLEGAEQEQAMQAKLIARSYIGYYDANGLFRYYYNNYTGTSAYHGCRISYSEACDEIVK